MHCKNCGEQLPDDSKFCPNCGEKIVKRGRPSKAVEDSTTTEDNKSSSEPNKILYRDDFQQNYYQNSNSQVNYIEKDTNYKKNPCSIIALVLFIVSIIGLWYLPALSIIFAITSLVLAIVGKKHTNPSLGVTSLVFSILGFIVVMISAPIILIGSIEFDFGNGYKTTFFEYLKGAFNTGYNQDSVYGNWEVEGTSYLLVLGDMGNYNFYTDKDNKQENFYFGEYSIESGVDSRDYTQYADNDYYYYTMDTDNQKYNDNGTASSDWKIFYNDVFIKINKNDKTKGILYIPTANIELEIKRQYNHF